MRKFGIRMEGCEAAIEELLRGYIQENKWEFFRYLEIGVASGETLRSVTEIVADECAKPENAYKRWATVGVDLPDGWALSMAHVRTYLEPFRVGLAELVPPHQDWFLLAPVPGVALGYGRPNLFLANSQTLLREVWNKYWDIDVALIDGCHGKACVKADFEALEHRVLSGGYVLFHDAGALDQGGDYQPHCQEPIAVRAALDELGLLNNLRPCWQFVREIPGDKSRGGNSIVVVKKC